MSRSSWLDIKYDRPVPPTAMIAALVEHGWHHKPRFGFLPLHDGDNYQWTEAESSSWDETFTMFHEKEEAGEQIGVTLQWEDTEIRCTFILKTQELSIDFAWYPNRHLAGFPVQYTDLSWYLTRLLPPIFILTNGAIQMEWHWI